MIAASALSRRLASRRPPPPPPSSSSSSSSTTRSLFPRDRLPVATVRRTAGADARNGAEVPPPPPSSPSASSFAERNPFLFQLGVATTKTSAADIMVQVVVDGRDLEDIDYKRNAIFVVFGFAYLGGFQYWLMVTQYTRWFPTRQAFSKLSLTEKLRDRTGMIDAAKMVAFDVFVHLPFLYFPSYYACKEIVTGKTWNPIDWIRDGCAKYWNNKEEDLSAMIKLWGPVDCIQFSMPIHYSMPFRHIVSFFWTAYISFTRGAVTTKTGDNREGASDGDQT